MPKPERKMMKQRLSTYLRQLEAESIRIMRACVQKNVPFVLSGSLRPIEIGRISISSGRSSFSSHGRFN